MPESKSRKKPVSRQAARQESAGSDQSLPSPLWYKVVMFGLMIIGLLWIIVYYMSSQQFPVPQLGSWNIMLGFGIAMVGFLMTTRWH